MRFNLSRMTLISFLPSSIIAPKKFAPHLIFVVLSVIASSPARPSPVTVCPTAVVCSSSSPATTTDRALFAQVGPCLQNCRSAFTTCWAKAPVTGYGERGLSRVACSSGYQDCTLCCHNNGGETATAKCTPFIPQ